MVIWSMSWPNFSCSCSMFNTRSLTELPIYLTSKVRNIFALFPNLIGLLYILGVGTTLTDPQIMMKPDLGSKIFGDSIPGEAFSKFQVEHECNRWCKWFELEKLKTKVTYCCQWNKLEKSLFPKLKSLLTLKFLS